MNATVDLSEASNAQRQAPCGALPAMTDEAPSDSLEARAPQVPAYLREIYHWAYLNPRAVRFFDSELIVSLILWGNHRRLRQAAFAELRPGQKVLQSACVYGDFSPRLARHIGPEGRLEVIDVAPIQVDGCRHKLRGFPQASVRHTDAAQPGNELHDVACCYFLLHELPRDSKHAVVDALLRSVVPGGKVVFVDYHRPHWAHPLKPIMSLVFDTLEPFAKDLWHNEVSHFGGDSDEFVWRKQTYFGGLYQKVVAERTAGPA
jgi:ubiquinone/menaquinone biosynthesis C-methylase UbiE